MDSTERSDNLFDIRVRSVEHIHWVSSLNLPCDKYYPSVVLLARAVNTDVESAASEG